MAGTLARVLALPDILQAGGTRTLHELSDRLGAGERTVRRYAGHLLDLDVPAESARGRYGGYRLAPGHRMPPLMLTGDEAVAALLALIGTRRATRQPDTAVAVESATAKGAPGAAPRARRPARRPRGGNPVRRSGPHCDDPRDSSAAHRRPGRRPAPAARHHLPRRCPGSAPACE